MIQMQDQLAEINIPEDAMRNVVIRNSFDLTQQGRFIDLMKKYKPSPAIIDSWSVARVPGQRMRQVHICQAVVLDHPQ